MANSPAVLAELWRGGYKESVHFGHVAVVDAHGKLYARAGDPQAVVFARSTWKPVQALALVESGAAAAFGFSQAELALAAASHYAEEYHVRTVSSMLAKIGLSEQSLQCGAHAPYSVEAAAALSRAGQSPRTVHSNCSGKHTGMLAAAKHMGADLDTYLDPQHPVQRFILRALCDLTGLQEEEVAVAVDGCGAPVFGVPLVKLAHVFAQLADPDSAPEKHREALRTIRDAMVAHPEMVAGTGRFCTELMRAYDGQLVAKAGAEGVYGVGLLQTAGGARAFAVKVLDGASRAAEPAVCRTLSELGAINREQESQLASFGHPIVLNVAKHEVGEIRSDFALE